MAKKPEDSSGPSAPEWIVTFADMVSLLVTFFILLMTFSSLEELDAFKVDKKILGTTGFLTINGGPSAIDPPPVDIMMEKDAKRGAQIPHARDAEKLLENIDEMGQKLTEEHTELDLRDIEDGLVIEFDDRASFAPGSTELSEHLRGTAGEIARVLENYPYFVVIEGHTDDHFQRTQLYPSATALSAARAASVAEEMVAKSNLDPKQIQIAGRGDTLPLEPNDTPEGRRRNRRVVIRVMSLDQARAGTAQSEPAGSNG